MNDYKRIATSIFTDEDYGRQMRFLAGPRQCGKTFLIKNFLEAKDCKKLYYNWDSKEVKARYRNNVNFFLEDIYKYKASEYPWLCFDEIHKTYKWKNILKASFDEHESKMRFIISGSARLDLFRRSGDSLAGRYLLFHLYPLNFSEFIGKALLPKACESSLSFIQELLSSETDIDSKNQLNTLLKFSGFPEVLINGKEKFHMQWQKSYTEKIIYEDLRDISQIKDLEKVSDLLELMPHHVGSPISINSLSKNLGINFATTKNYLQYLDLSYLTFRVKPYSKNLERTLKKEFKTYFFDWSRNLDEAKIFENYVALELLAWCNYWTDSGQAKNFELYFIRNTDDQKETDFLIVRNSKPWLLIEAKVSEENIASHHYKHAQLLGKIPFVQITLKADAVKVLDAKTYVMPAHRFFG